MAVKFVPLDGQTFDRFDFMAKEAKNIAEFGIGVRVVHDEILDDASVGILVTELFDMSLLDCRRKHQDVYVKHHDHFFDWYLQTALRTKAAGFHIFDAHLDNVLVRLNERREPVELKFVDVRLWHSDRWTLDENHWINEWLMGYWPPKV